MGEIKQERQDRLNIIVINTAGLGIGGITFHMINTLERIQNYNIDIVVTGCREDDVINKFKAIGCNILFLPDRKRDIIRYIYTLKSQLSKKRYDVIHIHGNSSTMVLECKIAQYYKIQKRIVHCHNSICTYKKLNKLLLPFFKKTYTKALACSELAGEWLFGKNEFSVICNAIDLNRFKFDKKVRCDIREELGIRNKVFVVGHVGNFTEQKNHEFLIDIFFEVQKNINTILILVGNGYLQKSIKKKVEKMGINDKVKFLGTRNDINRIFQAIDVFILPSKWEGLPLVLVEAQSSGLPCIISNKISKEANITETVKLISLDESFEVWNNQIKYHYDNMIDRQSLSKRNISILAKKGYSVKDNVKKLKQFYNS